MKKGLLTSILLILIVTSFAQRLKYKDVFEVLNSGNEQQAYNLLFEFQKSQPQFPNTYFQLGRLSYKWAFETDPFLEYKRVMYFIYNTKLFFNLAKKYLSEDKNDVKKNRKYYLNEPQLAKIEKLKYEDVIAFIDKRLAEIKQYERELKKIYALFYKMVESYNATVQYYRNIIKNYPNIKDLYLAPSKEILPKLDTLNMLIDTALYMYEQFKTAITSYPIGDYNPELSLQPIKTYRLEGITATNFLADTIYIWDYKNWARTVRAIINNDILALRSIIEVTNAKIKAYKRQLEQSPYSDDIQFFNLDKKVIYQIEKYDYKSLVSALLLYQKSYLDFLAYSKLKYNDTTDNTIKFITRARNYRTLLDYKQIADSMLAIVESRINPKKIWKFQDFFRDNYPEGLKVYINNQKQLLKEELEIAYERYKYFIYRDLLGYAFDDSLKVPYKTSYLPLYVEISRPEVSSEEKFYIQSIQKNNELGYFVSGFYRTKDRAIPIIARVIDSSVQWLAKEQVKRNEFVSAEVISLTPSAVATVIYKIDANYERSNRLVLYSLLGKKITDIELIQWRKPVFLSYDDINNWALIGFKDNSDYKVYGDNSPLVVELWDVENKLKRWQVDINLTGGLFDIVRVDTVFYLFVNYKSLNVLDKSFETEGNGIAVIKVSISGKLLDVLTIEGGNNIFGLKAIKLSNREINIVGLRSLPFNFYKTEFENQPKLRYLLYEIR